MKWVIAESVICQDVGVRGDNMTKQQILEANKDLLDSLTPLTWTKNEYNNGVYSYVSGDWKISKILKDEEDYDEMEDVMFNYKLEFNDYLYLSVTSVDGHTDEEVNEEVAKEVYRIKKV
jgi:hypothetical protein